MNITFTGKIIAAEAVQQGTTQQGTPWVSQNYVIEEPNQQYPSRAVFQVYGNDKLQNFSIRPGEFITVHLGINARQSKDGRWFNRLDCWKVDRFSGQQQAQQNYQQPQQVQQFPPQGNTAAQPASQQYAAAIPQQGDLPF